MNYKEMYLELFRATEKAINVLVEAQQICEEKYVSRTETIALFPIQENE